MLKLYPTKYKERLLDSINYSFANGYFFRDWKEVLTIFIGKSNQKKVRPSSMSSCVGKLAERLVSDRLMWLAEKGGWLDNNQNEFRKGRSCVDNLVRLTTDIEISRCTNRNTIAIFLDVSSAYDNVRTNILCDILENKGCPSRIINFVDKWMRNRYISFAIGDE